MERDAKVPLYQGTPEDIHLAVVSAGSSHSASISRRCGARAVVGADAELIACLPACLPAGQPGRTHGGERTQLSPAPPSVPHPARRGELYTWGLASSGELGHGGWTPIEVSIPRMITSLQRTRIVSVACGANHTLAISETGQLWSCGRGRHGQVCAWRGGAAPVWCGRLLQLRAPSSGLRWPALLPTRPARQPPPPQLGHGHFHDEGLLLLVETIRHERIVSVAAGRAHSVALAADGKMFTWGDASKGQLGHAQLAAMMQARMGGQ